MSIRIWRTSLETDDGSMADGYSLYIELWRLCFDFAFTLK